MNANRKDFSGRFLRRRLTRKVKRMSNEEFRMKNADFRILNSKFDILRCLGMILLMLTIFNSGCDTAQNTHLEQNYYYLNPQKNLSSIGRVVIVELENESSYPQISIDVTETLFQSLQKKQVFGLSVVGRNDPSWRSLRLEEEGT